MSKEVKVVGGAIPNIFVFEDGKLKQKMWIYGECVIHRDFGDLALHLLNDSVTIGRK